MATKEELFAMDEVLPVVLDATPGSAKGRR